MNTYKYTPYYSFNGPTASDPLREELSVEDQHRNLELFFTEVVNIFDDSETIISKEGGNTVIVETNVTEKECDERIKNVLNSLDLFAKKS
ncbi:hypothetical protein AB3464_04645 [Pseudomonas asplenii]|uniref:hypothetical protein n=1 Tax=Pseudomonas asplenii TaxID=53407 RepID=UPI0037C6EE42